MHRQIWNAFFITKLKKCKHAYTQIMHAHCRGMLLSRQKEISVHAHTHTWPHIPEACPFKAFNYYFMDRHRAVSRPRIPTLAPFAFSYTHMLTHIHILTHTHTHQRRAWSSPRTPTRAPSAWPLSSLSFPLTSLTLPLRLPTSLRAPRSTMTRSWPRAAAMRMPPRLWPSALSRCVCLYVCVCVYM